MLTAEDPVTWSPRRVAIAGVSGAGKSTLAWRLAPVLELDYTEIDGLFHGPQWQPRPSFAADVAAILGGDAWLIDWQYPSARGAIAARADTLVWLDLPLPLVFGRLLRRTVRRSIRREPLWNGNVEPALHTLFTDRDHILRWAFRTRRHLREIVPPLERTHPTLRIVRLRSARDVAAWTRMLVAASAPPAAGQVRR